ncbi:MAG: hypothetical protein H0U74_05950 [Bradymonadaceae bacterium]|nr:hypothetical protein [Lujinxingiaceae bacterium]
MSEKNSRGQLTRLGEATSERTRALAAQGKAKASSLQHSLERRLLAAFRQGADAVLERLGDPKNAVVLQEQLARLAQLGFEFGFRLDPNAAKLYGFVNWIEARHGRQPVMALVLSQNLLTDGRLLHLLFGYATFLSSPGRLAGQSPGWESAEIEDFKREAGRTLLTLLAELAALETGQPTPSESTERMVAFFEAAPIPEEFKALAGMAAGTRPDDIVMPGQARQRDAKGLSSRLRKLRASITENTRSGLARYVPGVNDPTFHFIVFSYTFFLETFLLRNLIENLPQMLEGLGPLADQLRDGFDEPIEM